MYIIFSKGANKVSLPHGSHKNLTDRREKIAKNGRVGTSEEWVEGDRVGHLCSLNPQRNRMRKRKDTKFNSLICVPLFLSTSIPRFLWSLWISFMVIIHPPQTPLPGVASSRLGSRKVLWFDGWLAKRVASRMKMWLGYTQPSNIKHDSLKTEIGLPVK